jgi:glycosyltransferase involved in cell wall biosynthesis
MNTLFVITSMPVGGAEVLLINLIRRLDRSRVSPFLVCLKELGPLGEELAKEIPTFHNILKSRYDLMVMLKLRKIIRDNNIQAVVTVGAGDKMFWGRLAAKIAGVPVICSALHSTGWPDGVGLLNRSLTSITDAFIAVARSHGEFLTKHEKFPASKVAVIPNGIDLQRFSKIDGCREQLRSELGLPADAKLVGIVAALRKEKNHLRFIDVAKRVCQIVDKAHFVIVGDGPERAEIEAQIARYQIGDRVHLLGTRSDIHQLLPAFDVFTLTSDNEANPVSILESLACSVPVVATDVGSVNEMVIQGKTGFVTPVHDVPQFAEHVIHLLSNERLAKQLGENGREHVTENASLQSMVSGYERLLTRLLREKTSERHVCEQTSAGILEKNLLVRSKSDGHVIPK